MKKVCHITTVHPVFDIRIFHKECRTLLEAGYNVSLIAQYNKNEIVAGVKIIALPKPKNRLDRIFFLSRRAYKLALQEKADIYHFHDPELLPWMILLKTKNKKVIYDIHEDFPEVVLSREWVPFVFRKLFSLFLNWFEKKISRRFDFLIATTPTIKNNFTKHKVIFIGTNFPKLNLFCFSEKRTVIDKKNCKLIYVGGIEEIRGIKEITSALVLVNSSYNIKLKLIGKFNEKRLKEDLEKTKGWEKIRYLGILPVEKVYDELFSSDIGLVCLRPIKRFLVSHPLKIFEYMASGLPVIASNFPMWKEIIEDNNCGICVDPLNPREIASSIEYLIEHPKEAREMGENGKKAVLEKYNWERESKKLLNIYESLMEKN